MAWIAPNQSRARTADFAGTGAVSDVARTFLAKVYRYMAVGLAITGAVAVGVASSPAALNFVFGNRMVMIILILAQLGMVLAFAPVAARVSTPAAAAMFFAYSALSGVTFSAIFLTYTSGSIGSTFLITGGMFAGLSAYGAITKRDLSTIGSFCMMGLFGLIIASIVNVFVGSSALYWLTTFMGVLVFTGLTAYDTAKLKALAEAGAGREDMSKLALQGALTLYLDFVNLFLMLLRIFGRRR